MHLLDGNDGRSAPCGRGVRRDGVSWAGRPGRKLRCRQGGGPSAAHRGAASSGMGGWDTRTGQGTAPSQGWRRCGRSWRDRRAPGLASAGHSPAFPGPRNTGRGATETHRARKSRSGRTAVCTASPRRPGRGRPFRTWTGPRRHREAKEPPEAAQPPPPPSEPPAPDRSCAGVTSGACDPTCRVAGPPFGASRTRTKAPRSPPPPGGSRRAPQRQAQPLHAGRPPSTSPRRPGSVGFQGSQDGKGPAEQSRPLPAPGPRACQQSECRQTRSRPRKLLRAAALGHRTAHPTPRHLSRAPPSRDAGSGL